MSDISSNYEAYADGTIQVPNKILSDRISKLEAELDAALLSRDHFGTLYHELSEELDDEKAGRPLLAKATDKIAELENQLTQMQEYLAEAQETCKFLGLTAENLASQLAALREENKYHFTDGFINWFADHNGYLEVWRSWRDTMVEQGRNVPAIRMDMNTLPQNDIELDQTIAFDVIRDFVDYIQSHPHPLPPPPSSEEVRNGQVFENSGE
jgi:hypothetical protein